MISPISAIVTAGSPASFFMLYKLYAWCIVPTSPLETTPLGQRLLSFAQAQQQWPLHITGSGKTSLANLIVHSTPLRLARPTVGCNTYVTTVGGPEDGLSNGSERQTFVELWDIGALLCLVA